MLLPVFDQESPFCVIDKVGSPAVSSLSDNSENINLDEDKLDDGDILR